MHSRQLLSKLKSDNAAMDYEMKFFKNSIASKIAEENLVIEEIELNSSSLSSIRKQLAALEDQNHCLMRSMDKIRQNCATSEQLQMEIVQNLRALDISKEKRIKKCEFVITEYEGVIASHKKSFSEIPLMKDKKKAEIQLKQKRMLLISLNVKKQEIARDEEKHREITNKRLAIKIIRLSKLMVEWKEVISEEQKRKELLKSATESKRSLIEENYLQQENIKTESLQMIQNIVNRSQNTAVLPTPKLIQNAQLKKNALPQLSIWERLGIIKKQFVPANQFEKCADPKQIGLSLTSSTTQFLKSLTDETAGLMVIPTQLDKTAAIESFPKPMKKTYEVKAAQISMKKMLQPEELTTLSIASSVHNPLLALPLDEHVDNATHKPVQLMSAEPTVCQDKELPKKLAQTLSTVEQTLVLNETQPRIGDSVQSKITKRVLDQHCKGESGKKDVSENHVEPKKVKFSSEADQSQDTRTKVRGNEKMSEISPIVKDQPKINKRVSFMVTEDPKGGLESPVELKIMENVSSSNASQLAELPTPQDSLVLNPPASNENSPDSKICEEIVNRTNPEIVNNNSPPLSSGVQLDNELASPPAQSEASSEHFDSLFGALFGTAQQKSNPGFSFSPPTGQKAGSSKPPTQSGQDFFSFFGTPTTNADDKKPTYADNFFKLF